MDIESDVYYKDEEGTIGANVLIYNDSDDIVERIVIVEEKCFQSLKDKIDNLDTAYLSKEDLISILENTAEDVTINATKLNNFNSGDFALRQHNHTDYCPKNHASSGTTYGLADTNEYGHSKLRNDLNASRYVKGEALSSYQGNLLDSRVKSLEEKSTSALGAYEKNSMRIKIGRWSDSQGEDGTRIQVLYQTNGIYAKLYCDKSDFNYEGKDIVLVLNGIPYTRTTDRNGKSERLAINLNRGTYILTAFIKGYEGLNPATDMKIIEVL